MDASSVVAYRGANVLVYRRLKILDSVEYGERGGVSDNILSFFWSPDGTKIAFLSSNRGVDPNIYVMNADGSGQTRLTNDPGPDASPSWSPDGTKIAFTSDRDGNYEIYVMNADGSNQTRLTNNPADDTEPSWSPRRSNTKSR
mgnify:CR=1 FL=1